MSLAGSQLKQIQEALLAAFDEAGLEQLCAFELDVELGAVTAPGTRTERTFSLLMWAQKEDRCPELIAAAWNCKPGNGRLQALIQKAQNWPACQAAGLVVIDGRASVFAAREHELAYLDAILADYEQWAQKYTPLAGIAEVTPSGERRRRLSAPDSFLPPEFALLGGDGPAATGAAERRPVGDLRQAVRQYRRLVVLGEPGSGKTTTMQMLRREFALAARQDPAAPLPLLAALGGYSGDETALEYVALGAGVLGRHLPSYLHSGRTVLLLDALNEMPQRDYHERVERIRALIDRFKKPSIVVTCRALDYNEKLDLPKLEVKPLDVDRQREYLHHYLEASDGEALFWRLAGGDEVAALWRIWEQAGGGWQDFWQAEKMPDAVYKQTTPVQDTLWARLRAGELPPLLALGANPYLLAMLIDLYDKGEGTLPHNRAQLFAGFAAVLIAREQRRRQASGAYWLGENPLQESLAQLAFAMQRAGEHGTAIESAWAEAQLPAFGCPPGAVLRTAADATLLDLSGGQVRFVHQLIQEYFAALAWQARLAQGDDLRQYWRKGWTEPSGWEETAVLLAGLLPNMTPFVERLLPIHPPLAARCIAESGGERPGGATIETVQARLVEIITSLTAPTGERNAAGNAVNYVGDPRGGVRLRPDGIPDMIWCPVPAGEFLMGNTKATDEMAFKNEQPQHVVDLPAFAISRYPVTNAQYQAFVDDGGYTIKWQECWTEAGWSWKEQAGIQGPRRFGSVYDLANHPVVGASWYEAVAFCKWLAGKLKLPIMLPSEAQWEKAARGIDGRRYPWGAEITLEHANYAGARIGATSAVGVFPLAESPFGLLDASGNVWEWTTTKWANSYQNYKPDNTLEGDVARTVRGGAWGDDGFDFVRCADRNDVLPDHGGDDVGFRVVSSGGCKF